MTTELLPLGMHCARSCSYCYQGGVRAAGNALLRKPDMKAMRDAVVSHGNNFTLFGGEPLLLPMNQLREIVDWEEPRCNSVQTDGYLLTDEHIELFRSRNIHVGVSIDGPMELNDARVMSGGVEATREATLSSMNAIDKMLETGASCSVIITLNKHNASSARLHMLRDWIVDLYNKGMQSFSLHLLEVDGPDAEVINLSNEELVSALEMGLDLFKRGMSISPFRDWSGLMSGDESKANCVWVGCDPYTTPAVQGIDGQGVKGNCGRTYKRGVQMIKARLPGNERYISLYNTPIDYGGCSGCKYWLICRGGCPGEGKTGDWREKTVHCDAIREFLPSLESWLVECGQEPFITDDCERENKEQKLYKQLEHGGFGNGHGDVEHGDHWDYGGA